MIQFPKKKKLICKIWAACIVIEKMTVILPEDNCHFTMIMLLTQNQFLQKNFVNTNTHAKFGIHVTSGLVVK